MQRMVCASLVFGVVLAVTGCGSGDEGVSDGRDTPLEGRTFLSEMVVEDGADRALVPGTIIRIEFRSAEIRVTAGCNHLFGTLESTEGGVLTVSAMGGSEMGCDPERHAQDEWIAAFLSSDPSWTLDGDRLFLASDTVAITLLDRVVADPDVALEGTRWVVDTIITGESASSIPGSTEAHLEFVDGQLTGSTGCNELFGSYTVDGRTIRIHELGQTDMMCGPDAMVMEGAVRSTLLDSVDFAIEARRLTLDGGSGSGLGLSAEG